MSDLITKINVADRLAGYWRSGQAAAIAVEDLLTDLGFYAVVFGERHVVAYLNGVRFELGEAK